MLTVVCSAPAAVTWKTYSNPRYGFRVDVPSTFEAQPAPANGDGAAWRSTDGAAELRVWGSNVVDPRDLTTAYKRALRQGTVTYKKFSGSWFAVSGISGGQVFYEKQFGGAGCMNAVRFTYPAAQKKRYDPMVTHVEASFAAGPLTQSH